MCNDRCLRFGERVIQGQDVAGRDVLDVGSRDFGGSLRPHIEALGPARYVGVDILPGPGVDAVCDAVDLADRFGPQSFDLVVTTEALEHMPDWRAAITALKAVLRPGGLLVLTTRSRGFGYHGYPADWWRFEVADMAQIFDDMELRALEPDPGKPGVFVAAVKPPDFLPRPLGELALYSIVARRRCLRLRRRDRLWFALRYRPLKAAAQAIPAGPRERLKRALPRGWRAWN